MPIDFAQLSPQRMVAREIRGVTGRGQSSPLFVECEADGGQRVNVVLKLRDPQTPEQKPWNLCLVRDLVGTILARRLDLNVPDYALVRIDDEFIRATARHPEGSRIAANAGINFGSVRVDSVSEGGEGAAADWAPVLTFDALGLNSDRKVANPNALWTGKVLFLIDHGMVAPTWTFYVDGTTDDSLYGHSNIHLHAGFPSLKGKGSSYDDIANRWVERISFEFLGWLRGQVPAAWAPAAEIDRLFTFVSARAGMAGRQEAELRGVVK